MPEKVLQIENGVIAGIYSDEVKSLLPDDVEMYRASHVEPIGSNWQVDLTPVGGPIKNGFEKRSDALEFEENWINENIAGLRL